MDGRLLDGVARWLDQLEATQDAMLELFRRKKTTLKTLRAKDLVEISREECALVERLQQRLARRAELLAAAQDAGLSGTSLTEVVAQIDDPLADSLSARMRAAERRSEKLRRESWVQWIVTQRSSKHYSELLDLIARRGEGSPTYDRRQPPANSGAFLDASA
ncbi:MAG: flagellar export chaperone FlgN [Planctomycetaceae bacterium]